jgi:fragile X mental retardation protein
LWQKFSRHHRFFSTHPNTTKQTMEDLSVEVQGPTGAYYRAVVVDVLDAGVLLTFENNSKPDQVLAFTDVYLPSKSVPAASIQANEDVEVYFFVTDVKVTDGEVRTEILPNDCVRRLPQQRVPISVHTFKKLVLDIPVDVLEYAKRPEVLRDFQERTRAGVARVDDKARVFVVISQSDNILKRSKMLFDLFFRSVKQKFTLISRREDSLRRMAETTSVQPQGSHVETFTVPGDLMGLAIGTHGSNIQLARAVDGVRSVDLDDTTSTFTIRGDTEDAVKRARAALEYREDVVQIPVEMVGKVGHLNSCLLSTVLGKGLGLGLSFGLTHFN